MRFMNLPDEYTKDAKFLLLQIPFEHKPTYGDGASKGPEAIIEASQYLEYYDEQFKQEPFLKGIACPEPLQLPETPDEAKDVIEDAIVDQFPVVLGGDHSVTQGVVQGLEKNHEFGVLIFDAHSDFRYQWHESRYNHACIAHNISKNHSVAIVGVRSQDKDEVEEIETTENVHVLHAYDTNKKSFEEILKKLPDKLYISIDVDVFDPSFIRNTGTPEPGGFMWDQLICFLEIAFKEKEIIGTDIVEFAPKENYRAEAFSLAKLAYKIMALKYSQCSQQSIRTEQ